MSKGDETTLVWGLCTVMFGGLDTVSYLIMLLKPFNWNQRN